MTGCACVFVRREKQLFLNVYVRDFRMCVRKANIKPMLAELRKHLSLDDPTAHQWWSLFGSLRRRRTADATLVAEKTKLIREIVHTKSLVAENRSMED